MAELQYAETQTVPGHVARPPAPGEESAGPALVELVRELGVVAANQRALLEQAARLNRRDRPLHVVVPVAFDAAGNVAVKLWDVPSGAVARVERFVFEVAGRTWITGAIASAFVELRSAPRSATAAAGSQGPLGSLLDAAPDPRNFVAADTGSRFPVIWYYPEQAGAPLLTGPESFWLLVGGNAGALANLQGSARLQIIVDDPSA